jgi:hypothetical protein
MRSATFVLLTSLWITGAGCSKSGADNSSPNTAASFAPELRLQWPGEVPEGTVSDHGDGSRSYSAASWMNRHGVRLLYRVLVLEYPAAAMKDTAPAELLEAYHASTRKYELSRTPVTHGPKKYPGLDVRIKTGLVFRQLTVVAGRRLYSVSVSVSVPKAAALDAPDVEAFFDSFAID